MSLDGRPCASSMLISWAAMPLRHRNSWPAAHCTPCGSQVIKVRGSLPTATPGNGIGTDKLTMPETVKSARL
jgi:hypothetical protein